MATLTSITSPATAQGRAGTVVTIAGTGLSTTTKVNFGSKSVTPTSTSTTSVTAVAPTGCVGQVNVSVVAGGVTSNSVAFFYLAQPTCSVLSTNTGPASPAPLTITGSGLSTGLSGTVAFGALTPVTPSSVTGDTQLTVTPPTHGAFTSPTDTVDVIITTPGGSSVPSGPACQFTYYATPTVTGVSPTFGTAGTLGVVISGTNFVDVSTVTFTPTGGGTPVTGLNITSLGSTSVSVDVPASLAADTYDLRVTTLGGTSAIVPADVFSVVDVPTVTSLAPSTGAAGSTTVATGTNFVDVTGVTFTPTGGGTPVSATFTPPTTTTSLTITVPAILTPGTFDVQVSSPAGTSTIVPADVFTVV